MIRTTVSYPVQCSVVVWWWVTVFVVNPHAGFFYRERERWLAEKPGDTRGAGNNSPTQTRSRMTWLRRRRKDCGENNTQIVRVKRAVRKSKQNLRNVFITGPVAMYYVDVGQKASNALQ